MITPIPYFVSSINPFNSLLAKCYTHRNPFSLYY